MVNPEEGAAAELRFAPDQLALILQALSANKELIRRGSLSAFTTYYRGQRDRNVVENFIAAATIYVKAENIPEPDALTGLALILKDDAATWWQGIKNGVFQWTDAMERLRQAFAPRRPAHQIYEEIYSVKQKPHQSFDVFINLKRMLFAELPPPRISDEAQIDIIFSLINPQTRDRLSRGNIHTFDDLLQQGRPLEFNRSPQIPRHGNSTPAKRCTYCDRIGHTREECRTKKTHQQAATPRLHQHVRGRDIKPFKIEENTPTRTALICYGCGQSGVTRAKCTKCNSPEEQAKRKATIACYTCKMPGVVRATCPTCNPQASTSRMNALDTEAPVTWRMKINTKFGGVESDAYLDSGADRTLISSDLHRQLEESGVKFERKRVAITVATGKKETEDIYEACIPIKLHERSYQTKVMTLKNTQSDQTLIGLDLILPAGIIIRPSQLVWGFEDAPNIWHEMQYEMVPPAPTDSDAIRIAEIRSSTMNLREDEGSLLSGPQREQVNELLHAHRDLFSEKPTITSKVTHRIVTENSTPIAVPPYRLSPAKQQQLRDEVDKMLEEDIIEESESPWAAPVVMVPKPDGKLRVCIDYRQLNAITTPDAYPLPRIEDLLHSAKRTPYMSTIDLRSGYWQIPVEPDDQCKTAFITPFGLYQFKRMSFGLRNAPATFQRLIDRLRIELNGVEAYAYLDDILVLSVTFRSHCEDLRQVFDKIRTYNLKAHRNKCHFFCARINYLGHVLTPEGIQTNPEKIAAISELPEPVNLKQVQTFLQTGSWYRRFVPNFAKITKPLSDLTRKNTPWQWGDPQKEAFQTLKERLTTAPILKQADCTREFILKTDASGWALGAVLVQEEDGEEHPVEYASRLLNAAERNYSTTEREALAVVWAINKFRGYVEGAKIIVITDHQALRWLMTLKSPTGRLARWALQLQAYNIQIKYAPGKTNLVADTLSRPPIAEEEMTYQISFVSIDFPARTAGETRTEQMRDDNLATIITCLEDPTQTENNAYWTGRGYLISHGVLYRYSPEADEEDAQLVVPAHQYEEILQLYHDAPAAGHYGIDRTIQRITSRYYWKNMRTIITKHVKSCIECQRYKATNLRPAGLLQTTAINQRFEVVAFDLIGPLPPSEDNERWIFVIEDVATKWIELFAMETASAENCATLLMNEVILRYGTPRKFISDNGTQFVGATFQQLMYCMDIEHTFTPVYHPEANPVERKNRDIKAQMAIYVQNDHRSWPKALPAIRFAANTARCEVTGQTPAYLTFGRELRYPDDAERDLRAIVQSDTFVPEITPQLLRIADAFRQARSHNEQRRDNQKTRVDRHRRPSPNYQPGDPVMIATNPLSNLERGFSAKLAPRRDGPYRIIKKCGPASYEIASFDDPEERLGKHHASALTPYVGEISPGTQPLLPKRKRGRPRRLIEE
jgi:hypothetical protein